MDSSTAPAPANADPTRIQRSHFAAVLLGIFIISLILRFWGLERFNTFVFDEVYYADFAENYLSHTPFFNAHPPLSQYLIAIGIWIGQHLPFGSGVSNDLTGSVIKTWSYRWLNALTGAFIPLVVAGLAYQLTRRDRFALIAGLLSALDGLFLVESRYALNNIYLVLFGLLGQICVLIAARQTMGEGLSEGLGARSIRRLWRKGDGSILGWLLLSGFFFGCSASIKWNGLWFFIATAALYLAAWGVSWIRSSREATEPEDLVDGITRLPLLPLVGVMAIVPFLTYYILWIPHIQQNPQFNFWRLQWEIYTYHKGTTVVGDVHPYCSNWLTWLIMLIPVAYFYKIGIDPKEFIALKATNNPLPDASIYAVHAMGNPFLWWTSTAAIAGVFVTLLVRLGAAIKSRRVSTDSWNLLTFAMGYGGNLLPWMKISRCAFLYHYMGSSVFATLSLAYFFDRALSKPSWRGVAIWGLFLAAIGFVWWMPVYLGLPLDQVGYQRRMWFPSWVEGVNAFKHR
jgi:dolichyl-phosphate-mannose-protein mannosyltransferase